MTILNASQLMQLFKIDEIKNRYFDPVVLREDSPGFSIKRNYPTNIRYKPALTKEGKPNDVALLYVVYESNLKEKNKEDKKVPIFIRIIVYSKYKRHSPLGYDYNDKDCPTKESLRLSKKTSKPVELETSDQYVYDLETSTIKDSKNNEISGEKILDTIFQQHCDTVHFFKGFKLRWKLSSKYAIIKILDALILVLSKVLIVCFGRNLTANDVFVGSLTKYDKNDMQRAKPEDIDFQGYKSSKNVIITFCFLVVTAFLICHFVNMKIELFEKIAANSFLTICSAVCAIFFLDGIVPRIILFVINCLIGLKAWLTFRKMKA